MTSLEVVEQILSALNEQPIERGRIDMPLQVSVTHIGVEGVRHVGKISGVHATVNGRICLDVEIP